VQKFPSEASPEAPFHITATRAVGRRPHTLKDGDTFAVFDSYGDIVATPGGPDGLFYQDTRYLSHLELLINEKRPLLLGSNIRDDNSALFVDLTNPDFILGQHIVLEKDTVHISRTIFLWRETAYQRFGVRNYGDQPIDLFLSILFENDFADLFEVRGSHRERRGIATTKLRGDDQVLLKYLGLDRKTRHTTLTFDPPPDRLATGVANYDLHLAPGEMRPIFLTAGCDQTKTRPLPFLRGFIAARRWMREATRDRTSVETSNERTACRDKMRARIPTDSGLFVINWEISVCARLRGGAGRTRTSNQTVIAETRVNQGSPH
jgi:glycogen debranching enzyme